MDFKYFVYDIESITNKALLNRVLYAGAGLNDEEAYKKYLEELAKEGRDFVNPAFHTPISLAAIALDENFFIRHIGLLGHPDPTPESIVKKFWETYKTKRPVLIDFNGRGYDIRLMEYWAFQLGISIGPKHFERFGARNRFSDNLHLDLHEFLTNFGAIRFRGGLNLFAKVLNKPGKMDTKGDQVQSLYDEKKFFEIDDYCLGDAMDTYYVFLRTRIMTGQLNLEKEAKLIEHARGCMETYCKKQGYFKRYLKALDT